MVDISLHNNRNRNSWWADQWQALLYEIDPSFVSDQGTASRRGGSRRSRVQRLDVLPGVMRAQVRDRENGICQVSIEVARFTPEQWQRVIDGLADQAIFAAQLLAGDLPVEIEQLFAEAGVSLLPASAQELSVTCSACGDLAEAATPGNSNHGWGAAVDMALGRSPSVAKEPNRDPRFMDWAIANARQHGWSWETSEPWHLRLVEILGPSKHEMTLAKDATSAPTSASAPDPELRTGSTGNAVATLQTICMTHGWTDMTAADGKFGPRTEAAVKTMQGALGCTPDGVYGNRTAAALRNRLGREASGVQ